MNPQTRESLSVARPGRMTALMQAVAAGPKVLRVGVVRTGRVVEERILRRRTTVTIGWSESSTFVLADPKAPVSLRLFEYTDGAYFLNTTSAMSGRVVTTDGIVELSAPASEAGASAEAGVGVRGGKRTRIRLDDDARGKIVIGAVAFLFQFVTAPPVQPRPQLPISVIRNKGVDWRTTVIAAFSFMVHFGAIGAIYSDWLDQPVDYDIVVSNVIESVQPFVPMTDVTETPENVTAETASQAKGQEAKGKHAGDSGETHPNVAALRNAIDRFQMSVLGVFSGAGATADVLRSGEVPTGLLDEVAKRDTGVGRPGLTIASGGPLKPGTGGSGLASIGDVRGGGGDGTGTTVAVRGPRGTVNTAPPDTKGAPIRNAAAVIASLKGGFRRCYERALAENPDAEGRIDLSLKVGPGGEVQSATATPQGNLPSQVVGCIRGKVMAAQFDPPEGGGVAIVQVPVSLVRQQ
jgi:hypothetical protein